MIPLNKLINKLLMYLRIEPLRSLHSWFHFTLSFPPICHLPSTSSKHAFFYTSSKSRVKSRLSWSALNWYDRMEIINYVQRVFGRRRPMRMSSHSLSPFNGTYLRKSSASETMATHFGPISILPVHFVNDLKSLPYVCVFWQTIWKA